MKKEIEAAGAFLKNLIKRSDKLNLEQADIFVEQLICVLQEKYKAHWYPENPTKGQAFRCIRVNGNHSLDVELLLACQKSGVQYCYLGLPLELTLWVDPGEVSCRYSEDTPPFTLARFIGDDDDNDGDDDNGKVLLKVSSALEKVTSDYHSETSSDDDCVCVSPPPENDSAYATLPSERDRDSGKASQSIFGVTSSPENNTFSGTLSPPNRHGGVTTTPPQHRSPPLQVVYSDAQPLSPLSWRIPVRSPVEPRPYVMLNTRARPFPTVRPHGWSRPVYRNPMWSCSSARSHHGNTAAFWSAAGNERRFDGRMNLSRPLK
ncbi:maternal B9.10 protein-like [Sardina pilchardus]|uniref:maternal B9.10 protein-like n=1 Tax=Sardina pilchardus TaxID=27697 RepID=UPI002E151C09